MARRIAPMPFKQQPVACQLGLRSSDFGLGTWVLGLGVVCPEWRKTPRRTSKTQNRRPKIEAAAMSQNLTNLRLAAL